jgi:hypothetical protein
MAGGEEVQVLEGVLPEQGARGGVHKPRDAILENRQMPFSQHGSPGGASCLLGQDERDCSAADSNSTG